MALVVGTRLGHYDVTALIGEGGMGQVWQATDTQLNRQVALKILPDTFAADPERLARFTREAQILASLNHPNIAAIHGIEEDEVEGRRALVLELVEGPTLADRISKGPIPVDVALPIAKQIADALEAAHEAGVIHRDLKPANIKVRGDGTVKVLDFGLAKALDPSPGADPSQSPTLTAAATQTGVIMGTAAYMSPEQAAGQIADKRSDLWSFGVIVFEMLTGHRLFTGETVSHVLAKVLDRELDFSVLPTSTPRPITRLLRRCLERKPKRRLSDVGEALIHLEEAATVTTDEPPGTTPTAPGGRAGWTQSLPWAVAGIVIASVVTGAAVWTLTRSAPATPGHVTRTSILLPSGVPSALPVIYRVAVSPAGTHLVYGGADQLYLRAMGQMEATPIGGTAFGNDPAFSADGQWIAFYANGQLKKVSVLGGAPVTLCETGQTYGISWTPDDTILFTAVGVGILRVPEVGGPPEVIVPVEGTQRAYVRPQLLPGGEWVLFSAVPSRQVAIQSLVTGERRVVLENGGGDVRYLPTGHLVHVMDGTLMAVPFDLERLTVTGGSVPLIEGITQGSNGLAQFDHSEDGSLIYWQGGVNVERTLVWVGRSGLEEAIPAAPAEYEGLELSTNDDRIAYAGWDEGGLDVWIYDLARNVPMQLSRDPGLDLQAVWAPDGERVVWQSSRGGLNRVWSKAADGTGNAEALTGDDIARGPLSFTPDGAALLYWQSPTAGTDFGIGLLSVDDLTTTEVFQAAYSYSHGQISPDGSLLAYTSNEEGQEEIYVRPFPNVNDDRVKVSQDSGFAPRWAGNELFYQTYADDDRTVGTTTIMAVSIERASTISAGHPVPLFTGTYRSSELALRRPMTYDVSHDGQRFLMIKEGAAGRLSSADLVLVQNWHQELLERVPVD